MTEPRDRSFSTRNGWPTAAARIRTDRAAPSDVTAGAPADPQRRGRPDRRRRHDPPLRCGCRRSRRVADAVQRTRLRLTSGRRFDRDLPAQSWGRLLPRARASGRTGALDSGRRTPSPPCSPRHRTARCRTSSAPWGATPNRRSSSRSWPACCTPARIRRPRWPRPVSRSSLPAAGPFRLWWGDDLGICVEGHAPPGWMEGLTERGHRVIPIAAFEPNAVGGAQIICGRRTATTACGTSWARPIPAARAPGRRAADR